MTLFVALGLVTVLCAACYGIGFVCGKRGEPVRDWMENRWRHHRGLDVPVVRPIEAVVADLRRLGSRFHQLHPHASYAKVQAVRGAYDRSLAECCTALGLTHLLGVLPVGPELDAERQRVEGLLDTWGVELPYAA